MEYPKFKVTVSCMTYNQSKYITDAMNGFTMQQTSFPFVCTIVDDASTDGEQDVIRKYVEDNFDFSEGSVSYHKETDYAHITYAQHKTNKNCYFAVLYLKENHYSQRKPKMGYLSEWRDMCEYEALCEGDDYWIVPDKLEKQVSFLNCHSDYVMCFAGASHLNVLNNEISDNVWLSYRDRNRMISSKCKRDSFFSILLGECRIPTLTVLYRCEIFKNRPNNNVMFLMGDTPLWLDFSQMGKIEYLDEIMAVYRVIPGSASHKRGDAALLFKLSMYEMRVYYCNKYGYEIPCKLKNLYNYAYCHYLIWAKDVSHRPMFPMFKTNSIYVMICKLHIFSKCLAKIALFCVDKIRGLINRFK